MGLYFVEPVPVRSVDNPFAVQRPKATNDMLIRQGSFRGFDKLQESSPFKRTTSLRLNDLPSTLQRQNAITDTSPPKHPGAGKKSRTLAFTIFRHQSLKGCIYRLICGHVISLRF